ncbi:MAG: hypothetical protein J1E78_00875 [Muribaculaceae bacterium]|nr:hypothetical protein [Muribaculaceae bacterium]
MERDEKHTTDNADQIAKSMLAEQKDKQRETTRRMNRLWIWLGVLFLVAILIWFMYFLGFLEFLS